MEVKEALEKGDVFPREYVTQLRDEAKAHRLKAEAAQSAASSAETTATARATEVADAKKEGEKKITLEKIRGMLARAGVEVDPVQVYQDGMDAEKAFNEYVAKNPSVFKREPLKVKNMDLDGGVSSKILTDGTMTETRKDPAARGLLSKIYSQMVSEDKQRNRRRE